jgi:glycosyltransferase involved in cell wall biosynthesis
VELGGNPDLRAQLGRAARRRFEERFTEAEVRRRVASVYASFGL